LGAVIGAGAILVLCLAGVLIGFFGMPKEVSSRDRWGQKTGNSSTSYGRRVLIIACAIVGLIAPASIVYAAGNHSVPTKYEGVQTAYGKVVGEKGPGHFWIWPTHGLNLVSRTIQSDSFLQANGNNSDKYTNAGATGYCITVRLGMQTEGCADVQLQTETNASAIPSLYANYSSYGPNLTQDVDRYVVKRDLTTVLSRDLGDYNVIQDITAQLESCDLKKITTCTTNTQSQFSKFDPQLVTDLQSALGNQVHVGDVNLQYIHYDASTEAAIKKITNSYLETAQAYQQQQTNSALATAAANLQTNKLSLSGPYLQYLCYQTTQDAEKSNYTLPATWNCSGGSGAGVLINGAK